MFDTFFFAEPRVLWLGALTGLIFGFLLQKARVTRADTIIGQFLLVDHTVVKVMLTAVTVGGVGIYAMLQMGAIESLHVKSAHALTNALGGAIFGVGMAILGYCPGTGVAAIGDGSKDAWFGVLGMLAGAAAYAEAHPWVTARLAGIGDLGKQTLVTATPIGQWWYLALIAAGAVALFVWLERLDKRSTHRPSGGATPPRPA